MRHSLLGGTWLHENQITRPDTASETMLLEARVQRSPALSPAAMKRTPKKELITTWADRLTE